MNFVIVDVETTGGSPKNSKITEIALYKYDGTKIIDELVTLVNPEIPIPDFIVRLTGITDKMVERAPKFYEIAKQIIEFTQDTVFVAHNVAFDYGMLRSEFKSLGFDFRLPHLCTVRASRYVIPGHASYSLGKLSAELGIEIKGRHRAGGDAYATAILFDMLYHKDPNNLRTFIQQEVNPKSIHPNLNIDVIDELPTKTGVYKFFNTYNQLIYIGKSINIKKRVEQHLRNTKTAKGLQMIQDIAKVEYELTGSEMIAMLLESDLVKQNQPIYNRQLRKSLFPYGLFDTPDENGYLNLRIESIAKKNCEPIIQFTTRKEGQSYLQHIADKYQLCQKLCGLYPTQSACFKYTIKECRGACVQEESPETYNERVQAYIDSVAFEGKSFFILDKGRNKGEKSLVLVQKGTYKGYGYAPFHFNGNGPENWEKYIVTQKENRDVKTIVNLALRKGNFVKLIEL